MKTIFALFERYDDAKGAVEELVHEGFGEDELNLIVLAEIAKEYMTVKQTAVAGARSGELDDPAISDMDRLLVGHQPMLIQQLGPVYAVGEVFKLAAKTASRPGATEGGLAGALMDLTVPEEQARLFAEGVGEGGVLVAVRTSDEQSASSAEILRRWHGIGVANYAH